MKILIENKLRNGDFSNHAQGRILRVQKKKK